MMMTDRVRRQGVLDEDAGPREEAEHRAWQDRAGLGDPYGERAVLPSRHGRASGAM